MLTRLALLYKMPAPGGFSRTDDKLIATHLSTTNNRFSASGGLFSTPNDVMKFYQMLLRGGVAEDGRRVMSEGAIKLITTKQTPACVSAILCAFHPKRGLALKYIANGLELIIS